MTSEFINSKGAKAIDIKHIQHEERIWIEFTMSKQQKENTNKSTISRYDISTQSWKIIIKKEDFKA